MAWWASLLGAGAGAFIGGPAGAAVGAALGALVPDFTDGRDGPPDLPLDLHTFDEPDGRQLLLETSLQLNSEAFYVIRAFRKDGRPIAGRGEFRDDDGAFVVYPDHDPEVGGQLIFIPAGALDVAAEESVVLQVTAIQETELVGVAEFALEWPRQLPFSELHEFRPLIDLAAWAAGADSQMNAAETEFLVRELDASGLEYELRTRLSMARPVDIERAVQQCWVRLPEIEPDAVLELLAGLAACDGVPNAAEITFIRDVALAFDLDEAAWGQVAVDLGLVEDRSVYQAAYEALGLRQDASLAEAKSAFRRLMREYHPDTVATLPKGFQEFAKAKTIEIREAYELIVRSQQRQAG